MKTYRIIHIAANIAAFGVLGGFLVYFLISYGSLPEPLGVHFSAINGQIDVYADKLFGFYPFVMGFGLMGLFSALTLVVKKLKKLGLKLTEKGDTVFRCAAALILDLMKLVWSAFFSFWTCCVVHQTGMGDGSLLDAFRVFFLLLLLAIPILFSRIKEKYSAEPRVNNTPHSYRENPKVFRVLHIIANVIAFGLLGGFLVYFLISYGALPERIGVHFDGDGNFDVIMEKIFGLYPFVAGGGLLLAFSLLSLAVNKVKRLGLRVDEKGEMLIRTTVTEALDMFKLLWSVLFSMWSYCVINQVRMDLNIRDMLIMLFLALFPITAAVVIITARKHRIKDEKETENDNSTRN